MTNEKDLPSEDVVARCRGGGCSKEGGVIKGEGGLVLLTANEN